MRRRIKQVAAGAFVWLAAGLMLWGQGMFTVLQTGSGVPLQTKQEVLSLAGVTAPAVRFDFGFATDEVPTPGVLLDSFTVSLQGGNSNQTAVVVTADASGVLWAPPAPGAVPLADSVIQRLAITPPSLQPIDSRGVAFAVQVPVPSQFTGTGFEVDFDLFDNLNATMSLGWYTPPQVVSAPEASSWSLLSGGLLVLAANRRRGA